MRKAIGIYYRSTLLNRGKDQRGCSSEELNGPGDVPVTELTNL